MYSLLLSALCVSAPPDPPSQWAPTLHLRVIAPEGVRVTPRPGSPDARSFGTPSTFGFRPGYCYRIRLESLPDEPSLVIEPSIEVRSSLYMPVTLNPADYPAPLTITIDDIRRV